MKTLAERLLAKDTTLWPEPNVAANRLGWIGLGRTMQDHNSTIKAWAETVTHSNVVLLGMGGSSLGPEVMRAAIGSERLTVVDTTDPMTIESVPTDDTLFIVASKSGGTLEVRSMLSYFWDKCPESENWVAITDPGTELEKLAKERGFSRTFVNPPDIGGRFSVLSFFGLVPAALMGYDLLQLCQSAESVDIDEAVELGESIAKAAQEGKDKLTLITPPGAQSTLRLWLEQLIAESTGKKGMGIVPVPTTEPEDGGDRYVERIKIGKPEELGGEFYRWEIATAIAGHFMKLDPFDEPNVTESKKNTADVLSNLPLDVPKEDSVEGTFEWLKANYSKGVDYVSIQAYLPHQYEFELEQLRRRVRDALGGAPVTAGFGPRFLHSTGQLHKGGANNVVCLQLVPSEPTGEASVPGEKYDFATLIQAQSIGDFRSLQTHNRRVRRIAVKNPRDLR